MKKLQQVVIIGCLLLTVLLSGCNGEPTATPTAQPQTSTVSALESSVPDTIDGDNQPTESQPEQEEVQVESEGSKPVTSKEDKKETNQDKTTSSNTKKDTSTTTGSSDGDTAGLPNPSEVPTFTSFASFENWMKNGGSMEEDRQEILANAQTSSILSATAYYRPTLGMGNSLLDLSKVEVYSHTMNYYYQFTDNGTVDDLKIHVEDGVLYTNNRKNYNRFASSEREGETVTHNGITYYYVFLPDDEYRDNNLYFIYWAQNGHYYSARLQEHSDKIDQVLPLLTMERVTYSANSDHVTQ